MRERRLELTYTQCQLLLELHVEPSLLQQSAAAGRRIDGKVERYLPESLTRKTQHRIRH